MNFSGKTFTIIFVFIFIYAGYNVNYFSHRLTCTKQYRDSAGWCFGPSYLPANSNSTMPKDNHFNYDNASANGAPAEIEIQLNPNSTVAKDIIKILHNKPSQEIVIYLEDHDQRRCKHPQLRGRLSGPLISTMSWGKELHKQNLDGREVDVLTGHYRVPHP